ncbi:flagella basal body P-ring formation protein FlgA [Striga asiatica]|uniref:Flagella basal body P-ring formation protein FlgA n=1 Tax=Striga asiatica TaxID=4170 RepID=A0A5A7QES7_STRAF|nr:flagella basal body P-ring formation protein FlgA [Striga asiatica]
MRFIPVMQWIARQSEQPSRNIPDGIFTLARNWSLLSTCACNHIYEPDEFEVPRLRNSNITIKLNAEQDVLVTTIGMVRRILGLVTYQEPLESGSRGNKKGRKEKAA